MSRGQKLLAGVAGIVLAVVILGVTIGLQSPASQPDARQVQQPIPAPPRQPQRAPAPPPAPQPAPIQQLDLKVTVSKDPIVRGNIQTMTVDVSSNSLPIAAVTISGTVVYASRETTHPFSGLTDASGRFRYEWRIGGNSTPGTFTIRLAASKAGATTAERTITFQVTPAG